MTTITEDQRRQIAGLPQMFVYGRPRWPVGIGPDWIILNGPGFLYGQRVWEDSGAFGRCFAALDPEDRDTPDSLTANLAGRPARVTVVSEAAAAEDYDRWRAAKTARYATAAAMPEDALRRAWIDERQESECRKWRNQPT